jgi:CheY-like chemotaxis protein
MPVMNGFEFLDALSELQSSNELYQTIVFAMITSSTNPVDQTRAGDYECVRQYFGKDELSAARLHEMFNSEFGTN